MNNKLTATMSLISGVALLSACGGGGDPAPVQPTKAAVDCSTLTSMQIPNTTIVSAQSVPAGSFTPPGSTVALTNLPAFCRVSAKVTPVPDSSITIEVWLPTANWNGKYQQVGDHSWGGTLFWGEMAPQLRRGYATGATSDGHDIPGFDVSWAFGHPEKINDVAYRAIHELSAKAKLLIGQYYSAAPKYSYYNGCSNGGRGGMKSAQVNPNDFDGIIAGGAAQYWTQAATEQLVLTKNLIAAGIQGTAGAAVLNLAQSAATAACDTLDGVKDGIINDPRRCTWNPQSLVCTAGQDPATCFTPAQANAIAANIAQLNDPTSGAFIMSGQTTGSEFDQLKFGYNAGLAPFGLSNYKLAFNDPNWDPTTFDLRTSPSILAQVLGTMNATDTNLAAFKAAGKKLIQYHGWADSAFTPGATVKYYEGVVADTGKGDLASVQQFYRLFMLPGAGHCATGPNDTGPLNVGAENQTAVSSDAQHDIVSALEAWVEQGTPPASLIASKNGVTGVATMQRPICPYPGEAVYKGTGDTNDASNFTCQVK